MTILYRDRFEDKGRNACDQILKAACISLSKRL